VTHAPGHIRELAGSGTRQMIQDPHDLDLST